MLSWCLFFFFRCHRSFRVQRYDYFSNPAILFLLFFLPNAHLLTFVIPSHLLLTLVNSRPIYITITSNKSSIRTSFCTIPEWIPGNPNVWKCISVREQLVDEKCLSNTSSSIYNNKFRTTWGVKSLQFADFLFSCYYLHCHNAVIWLQIYKKTIYSKL